VGRYGCVLLTTAVAVAIGLAAITWLMLGWCSACGFRYIAVFYFPYHDLVSLMPAIVRECLILCLFLCSSGFAVLVVGMEGWKLIHSCYHRDLVAGKLARGVSFLGCWKMQRILEVLSWMDWISGWNSWMVRLVLG